MRHRRKSPTCRRILAPHAESVFYEQYQWIRWRSEGVWNPTFSTRKSLILLGSDLGAFRISRAHPNGSKSIITQLKAILLLPGLLHRFDGQVNNGFQTPFAQVAELYRPAMGLNDGSGNCQTQTGAARIAAARAFQTHKWFKGSF